MFLLHNLMKPFPFLLTFPTWIPLLRAKRRKESINMILYIVTKYYMTIKILGTSSAIYLDLVAPLLVFDYPSRRNGAHSVAPWLSLGI